MTSSPLPLTRGPLLPSLLSFALPYMVATLLQVLYGLADLLIVGLYCPVEVTTAVANGSQVMHSLTAVIIALTVGSTVFIARANGAANPRAVARGVGGTLSLFAAVAVVLAVLMLALRAGIVGAMDVPAEAVVGTLDYLTVCFGGLPFVVGYNVLSAIYRGMGDSRSPLLFVVVACVVNVGLDFLLIGGMGLGALGAAFGTVIAQAVSVVVAALRLRHVMRGFAITVADLRPHRSTLLSIIKVGVPVALQDAFIQLSFVIIMVIANGRGVVDAAAVGIVEKFIGLLFVVPSALLATTSTMSAQCLGAGLDRRARSVMWVSVAIAVSYGLAVSLLLQIVPDAAVALFTDDALVITMGAAYLRGYVWDSLLAGVHFCFSGFFTAMGKSYLSFLHNIIAIAVARIPLAYWASASFPDTLFPMGLATCVGSLLSVILCIAFYLWLRRRR